MRFGLNFLRIAPTRQQEHDALRETGKYLNLAIVRANGSHYLCTCKHNANICDIMQQYFRISAVLSVFIIAVLATAQAHRHHSHGEVAGKVVTADASDVYATVVLKGTPHGSPTPPTALTA